MRATRPRRPGWDIGGSGQAGEAGLAEGIVPSVGKWAWCRGDLARLCEANIPAIRKRPFEPYERITTAVNGPARRIALYTIGETWSPPG
jgi:hypothetical protein